MIAKMDSKTNKLYYIDYLRAFACVLITNSHYKNVYPLDCLSFGGGFGVAIFFLISGFLLYPKVIDDACFLRWYLKKLWRIYKAWWIYMFALFLLGQFTLPFSISKFIYYFIFPTTWFVASIVICYGLFYWLIKVSYHNDKILNLAMIIVLCCFVLIYIFKPVYASFSLETMSIRNFSMDNPNLIMQPIWFLCMLIGSFLRKTRFVINTKKSIVLMLISLLVFFVVKVLLKNDLFSEIQILLPVSYLMFSFSVFCIFYEISIWDRVDRTRIGVFLAFISSSTLEIYFVQSRIINKFNYLPFPVDFILITVLIIASAYILRRIEMLLSKK